MANTKTEKKFIFKFKCKHTKFITHDNIDDENITEKIEPPDFTQHELLRSNQVLEFQDITKEEVMKLTNYH